MALYSSNVRTQLIDPVFDYENNRTEFRFPTGTVFLSNVRLINVGVKLDTAGGPFATTYNALTGAYGVLKNIFLYDGNTVLDSIQNVDRWLGFRNFNKSNDTCSNMNNVLSKNALGFVYDGIDTQQNGNPNFYNSLAGASRIEPFFDPVNILQNADDTPQAWLSLKDLLPMAKAIAYLDTTVFKNLRLVLEYTKTKTDFASGTDGLTYSTVQPLLIADELTEGDTKDKLMGVFEGIGFVAMEQDRIVIPALNPNELDQTPLQSVNSQVQGFNSKKVNRMVIMKTPNSRETFSPLYDNRGSIAQLSEVHQLRVNGQNLYPFDGLKGDNIVASKCVDIWGTSCLPLGAAPYMSTWFPIDPPADEPISSDFLDKLTNHFPEALARMGETSYICANLSGERVREFQFSYSRKGLRDPSVGLLQQKNRRYNQSLTLLIMAEVQKAIIPVKGGGYTVTYV